MPPPSPKRILIAPLDWGMGHTTRCIPLVRYLEQQGHTVLLAGNKQQRDYWRESCPRNTILPLDGYCVRYGKRGSALTIAFQVPKIMRSIRKEHSWLSHAIAEHKIDGVISDNRYGLYGSKVPSVILTHQLQVISGLGHWADLLLRHIHYRHLSNFRQCWVPDIAEKPGLAGRLSHPPVLPPNTQYIGLLSALSVTDSQAYGSLLIILSGPEPQRSILSAQLWSQLIKMDTKAIFIEGSASAPRPALIPSHIQWHSLLPPSGVQQAMQSAALIICRSGYSTIMDLALLQKRAFLVPTPGQSEQLYLARHLHDQGILPFHSQHRFSLSFALATAATFRYNPLPGAGAHNMYKQVLQDWVNNL